MYLLFFLILKRGAAMFYLLVCLTQDGWMEIFQAFQVEQSGGLVFETSNRVSAKKGHLR